MKRMALVLLLLVMSGWLGGASSLTDQSPSLALTLYSDLGLLEELYTLNAVKGDQSYSIAPIPHTLIPDSVIWRPQSETFRILEQEFLPAQTIHSSELLESYIGQEVEVTVARALLSKTYRGVLLSLADGIVLQEPSGRLQILRDYSEITLAKLPDYRKRPVLRWRAHSQTDGAVVGRLSYLVSGLGWWAYYTAVLNEAEDQLKLSSWVKVINESGRDYQNATLTLIAGELRRLTPPPVAMPMAQRLQSKAAAEAPFETKPAFEYHEYKLTRPATLKDQQTLQLSFLEAQAVKVSKHYVYEAARAPDRVRVEIRLVNDAANGLGVALPAGGVRLYKETQGSLQLIGEDSLEHTPQNERITLIAGMAFDLQAARTLKDRQVVGRDEFGRETYRETYEIKLRNQKSSDVLIEVTERLQGTWKILSSEPGYERLDANSMLFKVHVKAQSSATVTYTVEWGY